MIAIRAELRDRPDLSQRAIARAGRMAFARVGVVLAEEILPKHFTRDARTKYDHAPRSVGYLRRKGKLARQGKVKYGGNVDLVYTGRLEEAVLRGIRTIRPFPTRVTVSLLSAPRYMQFRPWKSTQPDKFREIERQTPEDTQLLEDTLARAMEEELQAEFDKGQRRVSRGRFAR